MWVSITQKWGILHLSVEFLLLGTVLLDQLLMVHLVHMFVIVLLSVPADVINQVKEEIHHI